MANYKVPQDVEADDKIIGPFSFRQLKKLGLNKILLISLFIFILPICFSLLLITNASAITTAASKSASTAEDLDWQVKSFLYRETIAYCYENALLTSLGVGNTVIKPDNFKSGKWFSGAAVQNAYDSLADGDNKDDQTKCSDESFITKMAIHWGMTTEELGKGIGFVGTGAGNYTRSEDIDVSEYQSVILWVNKNIYGIESDKQTALKPLQLYHYWIVAMSRQLERTGIDFNKKPDILDTSQRPDKDIVHWLDYSNFQVITGKYSSQTLTNGSKNSPIFMVDMDNYANNGGSYGFEKISLVGAIAKISALADELAKMAADYKTENPDADDDTVVEAVKEDQAGFEVEDAEWVKEGDKTTVVKTCNIDGGFGWVVCPVIKFMAKIADKAYAFIEKDFLVIDSSLLDKKEAKDAWNAVQGLANVAFIIAFLLIIFSQVTSVGITNYGIKKMLPKLIVAAVLVNLSYIFCQLAVDLSNIVGSSVNTFIASSVSDVNTKITTQAGIIPLPTAGSGGGLENLTGVILIGLGAGALMLSLSALIPMLLSAIISCVMILFILVGRKALIVILTVLSPLAFVAYLLPNTKKVFDMWKKTFMAMLMVYPIVAFVFAGSKLASSILMPPEGSDDNKIMMQVIASGVSVIPLFVVPGLLKKSMDGVAGIGNMVNKLNSSAKSTSDKLGKGITDKYKNSDFAKFRAAKKLDIRNRTKAGNYSGRNILRRGASKVYGAANNSKAVNFVTGGLGANRDKLMGTQDKADEKEFTEMTKDNDAIINAIANDGFNEKSAAFQGLSKENQQQIIKMKALNLHRKSSTYTATANHMSENGMGTGADIERLLNNARATGAKGNTIENAYNASIGNYKKSGRADAMFDLNNRAVRAGVAGVSPMTMEDAFAKINPTDISKYALKSDEGYDTSVSQAINNARGKYTELQKQQAYAHMLANVNNRNILATSVQHANDIKNPDAQKIASDIITNVTSGIVTHPLNDIQEAQNYVKDHGFKP